MQLSFDAQGTKDGVLHAVVAQGLDEKQRIERQHATDRSDRQLPARIADTFAGQAAAVATVLDALVAFVQAELAHASDTEPVAVSITVTIHRS
jgi:hypothetical protein